jgi:hypothetical protein
LAGPRRGIKGGDGGGIARALFEAYVRLAAVEARGV